MKVVSPPIAPVYRISRSIDPFSPTPWQYVAQRTGSAGSRFDDPRVADGLPREQCFRMVYCATARAGAFGETIAFMRPALDILASLGDVNDDEPVDLVLEGLSDPHRPRQGVVPADWRRQRRIGCTQVDPDLLFVDIAAAETLQYLRHSLSSTAVVLGVEDVDLSAIAGPHRRFTQECARYIYEQQTADGQPAFAGIRYVSRFNLNWECWAFFDTRFRHTPFPAESIHPTDPGLLEAARLFNLSVEGVRAGEYIQP